MPYPFKQIFAADPSNPDVVAGEAEVLIFAPGDVSRTPLAITDPTGVALPNPIKTNEKGFASAFIASIPQVAWEGAGLTGFMESFEGMRVEAATAAVSAASAMQSAGAAAESAAAAASSAVAQVSVELGGALSTVQQAAADAAAAAQLVQAPADTAVRALVEGANTETATALHAKFVGRGELVVNVRDYGAKGDGIADDSTAIQNAANATVLAGGGELLFPAGTYLLNATVTVGSGLLLNGPKATIHVAGNRPGLTVSPGTKNLRLTGLRFTGTLPADDVATIQNQVAIKAYAAWDNVIDGLEIVGCKFERIQGTAIQMQHVRNFRIQNNEIRKHGYAAIGGHSVKYGLIEGNDVEGTRKLPAYVANTYGIYVSTLEAAGPVGTEQNPRSSDVLVRNNRIRKQVWSCLDTHVGERISFIGNHIEDSPASAINAVYISMTAGDPDAQLAPRDILIEGNTITYPALLEPSTSMTMAILLRGSVSTDNIAGRERATGVIRGNIIRRYGRQDSSTSGAIFVGSGLGVIVEGNTLNECRSIGVHVRDSKGTILTGNTFVDLWRSTGSATAVFLGFDNDTEMDATVTGNRFVRGNLNEAAGLPAGAAVNNSAINGTNSAGISVIEGNNEWGTATFATAQTRYQVGTGRLRRMAGTAAPTTGTWLTGEQVINSSPTPGGYLGWVCTTNGTPGIWKGYGLIQT